MFNIRYRKTIPFIPRCDIIPIKGRLDSDGNELVALDHEDLRRAAERIGSVEVRSVASAFLFSYVNPHHELIAAEILAELAPGVSISLSHHVATEWREYERTASTVMDAYIAPSVSRYMADLSTRLGDQGMKAPLLVMQSNGGVISARSASERPLQTLLSGPVGGAAGGVALSEVLDRPNLICIDLGGTSFDVSLITEGHADSSPSALLEGLPVLMPVVDIHTIGAGGGSLAYLEAGGLRVGPESAGAHPGPACYGRGGTQPTVTDANLYLGRIDPDYFLGGNLTLDVRAAEMALEDLGDSLGLDGERLALGVIEVINAKMSQAIRTLTVERGIEPREFSLVAFGGAGPMHAVALAQELGIADVIVPPDPGGFSAWGMLQSAVRQDFSEAFFRDFADLDTTEVEARFARLGERAMSSLLGEGVDHDRISLIQRLDMRYQGQEHTLTVTLPNHASPNGHLAVLRERFEETYRARYGHSNPDASLETVNLRLTALGDVGRPLLAGQLPPRSPVRFTVQDHTGPIRHRFLPDGPLPPGIPHARLHHRRSRHRGGSHRHHRYPPRRVGHHRRVRLPDHRGALAVACCTPTLAGHLTGLERFPCITFTTVLGCVSHRYSVYCSERAQKGVIDGCERHRGRNNHIRHHHDRSMGQGCDRSCRGRGHQRSCRLLRYCPCL